jgi:hypothetical protein
MRRAVQFYILSYARILLIEPGVSCVPTTANVVQKRGRSHHDSDHRGNLRGVVAVISNSLTAA